jgi:DNA-binding MarR family transcriptional regulator
MVKVRDPAVPVALSTSASEGSLSLRLKRAERTLRLQLAPLLDAEYLLFEHWQIMAVLLARPGLRMSELAEAAVLPAASLTRHMDRLVERAVVIRRIDPDDKRSIVAALSVMGQALAERLSQLESTVALSI